MNGRITGRELTAAATRYAVRKTKAKPLDQGWQAPAWGYYSTVPEVRFIATWTGNALGGARLFAGIRDEGGEVVPAPDGHRAGELVQGIAGGPDGQAQMLGRFGPHLTVAGEGWIVIEAADATRDAADLWHVLSVREVRQQASKLVVEIDGEPVEIPPYSQDNPDDSAPIAIRVWQPHPERYLEADSPIRSSLDILEELQLLNAAVKAVARSRLTGRGILCVPQGTRFPSSPTDNGADDDLIDVLMLVAETSIRDPESAAATVPIVLELPADMIAQIKLLKFDSDFDDLAIKLREEAIRRFITGLEVPGEIVHGMGDVNHWGQWALSAEAIRLGIEPKLGVVCHGLTTQWLRPILEAEGVIDANRWMVWYDTSPLRVRTNRSSTALKLYELGAIGGRALRRETGFDESDAPTPEEVAARNRSRADNPAPDTVGTRLPVDETTEEPNTLDDPEEVASAAPPTGPGDGLLAAADGLIWAALGAAGEKLRRTPACPRSERGRARDVVPADLHTLLTVDAEQIEQWHLLAGAWSRVPEVAGRYGLDPECLTNTLDSYCRELIAAGVVHSYDVVPAVVDSCARIPVAA
jgi:hypothetical protein